MAPSKQARHAEAQFRVRDLMINVERVGNNGGGQLMPVDDGPIATPLTPVTPIIIGAGHMAKLKGLEVGLANLKQSKHELSSRQAFELVDRVALEYGRALVTAHIAGRFGEAAYCTEDMATCAAGEPISMVASEGYGALAMSDVALIERDLKSK